MTKQELAIKGVIFVASILIFLFCSSLSVWCMNRERNKSAIFWLMVSGVCALIMLNLSKYFN